MGDRVKDKVTIITGAGTGIGRACMQMFAREGATVIGVSRTQKKTSNDADRLRKYLSRFNLEFQQIKDVEA